MDSGGWAVFITHHNIFMAVGGEGRANNTHNNNNRKDNNGKDGSFVLF